MAEDVFVKWLGLAGCYTSQFVRFCMVGSVGTAVHYSALVTIVHFQGKPLLGSAVGFVLGALVNYVLNYRYTFQSASRHHETLAKFFTIACAGLMLNTLIMGLLIGFLHVHYIVSQLFATAGVVLWNFTMNLLWTFRRR